MISYKPAIQKWILLAVTLLMILAAAVPAAADEAEGWKTKGKKTWYYMAGESGTVKAVGLQKIGSHYYYFNSSGLMQTGWVKTADGYRYFRTTGRTGKLGRMYRGGLQTIDGGLFCFDENGVLVTGFTKVGKYTYYFKPTGKPGKVGKAVVSKWVKYEGDKYYFGPKARMLRKKWVGSYYVGKDGKRQKNTVTPDGYKLDSKGKKVSSKKVNGWVKLSKKWYYFDLKKKKFLKSTFKKIDGKRYYLDEDGVRVKGWQTINGSRYYFSKKGVAQTGEVEIGGKYYYFSKKGKLQINKTVDGYTTNADGEITARPTSNRPKVLIAAGHGQGDSGAASSLGMEYLKTREFASMIYKNLKASGKVDVTYYKDGSTSYDMYQRNAAALGSITDYNTGIKGNGKLKSTVKSRLKASSACPDLWDYDYVLEVHFNATAESNKDIGGNGVCKGFGVYVNHLKSSNMKKIDNLFLTNVGKTGFKLWGLQLSAKLLNARICQELGVNYSLIETAFIDDADDMKFYNKNKEKMAAAISSAIDDYLT